jgi:hypothetical protein
VEEDHKSNSSLKPLLALAMMGRHLEFNKLKQQPIAMQSAAETTLAEQGVSSVADRHVVPIDDTHN